MFIINPVGGSRATKEWRVLASPLALARSWDGAVTTAGLPETERQLADAQWLRPLELDPRAHASLADELKLLYVAMTRARRRGLVLFDTDVQKWAPLFAFLTSPVSDGAGRCARRWRWRATRRRRGGRRWAHHPASLWPQARRSGTAAAPAA